MSSSCQLPVISGTWTERSMKQARNLVSASNFVVIGNAAIVATGDIWFFYWTNIFRKCYSLWINFSFLFVKLRRCYWCWVKLICDCVIMNIFLFRFYCQPSLTSGIFSLFFRFTARLFAPSFRCINLHPFNWRPLTTNVGLKNVPALLLIILRFVK